MDLQIGDQVAFVPSAFDRCLSKTLPNGEQMPLTLTGTVIHINEAHRHYTVQALCHGYIIRESIKY